MTDNEIIKGLECCKTVDVKGCGDCPYRDDNCINRIMTDALDLILKQKAEIETAKSEAAREILSDLKKEVHNKATYTHAKDTYSFINLNTFDQIVTEMIRRCEKHGNQEA